MSVGGDGRRMWVLLRAAKRMLGRMRELRVRERIAGKLFPTY